MLQRIFGEKLSLELRPLPGERVPGEDVLKGRGIKDARFNKLKEPSPVFGASSQQRVECIQG